PKAGDPLGPGPDPDSQIQTIWSLVGNVLQFDIWQLPKLTAESAKIPTLNERIVALAEFKSNVEKFYTGELMEEAAFQKLTPDEVSPQSFPRATRQWTHCS